MELLQDPNISQFFIVGIKYLRKNNLEEEMFVLALIQRIQSWSTAPLLYQALERPNIMARGYGKK